MAKRIVLLKIKPGSIAIQEVVVAHLQIFIEMTRLQA